MSEDRCRRGRTYTGQQLQYPEPCNLLSGVFEDAQYGDQIFYMGCFQETQTSVLAERYVAPDKGKLQRSRVGCRPEQNRLFAKWNSLFIVLEDPPDNLLFLVVFMEAGYYYRSIDPKKLTTFGKQDAEGYYIQAGYFLVPEYFEIATRYSFVDPDNPNQIADNKKEELTVGADCYLFDHRMKIQLNYSFLRAKTEIGNEDDHLIKASVRFRF